MKAITDPGPLERYGICEGCGRNILAPKKLCGPCEAMQREVAAEDQPTLASYFAALVVGAIIGAIIFRVWILVFP